MADKDKPTDEYHYSDSDSQDNPFAGQDEAQPLKPETSNSNPVRRNALIVIGVVVVFFVMYRFIAPYFSGSKESIKPALPPVAQTMSAPVQPTPAPVVAPQNLPVVKEADEQLKKTVSTIEINQQGLRSDINSLNGQMQGLNTKLDELSSQINRLNQALGALSNQVAQQSHDVSALMVKAQPPKPKSKAGPAMPQVTYYIQAVIPGRAWLIGSNGSILTVREGIKIGGYGLVQLIDPMQGRVVTSSGKIIRFSPQDS